MTREELILQIRAEVSKWTPLNDSIPEVRFAVNDSTAEITIAIDEYVETVIGEDDTGAISWCGDSGCCDNLNHIDSVERDELRQEQRLRAGLKDN
jgi:hypothetical protein